MRREEEVRGRDKEGKKGRKGKEGKGERKTNEKRQ